MNYKYNVGDYLGPYNTLFLERTYVKNRQRHGNFKCSFCGKIFDTVIAYVVSGNTKSCGCQKNKGKKKYKQNDLIGPYQTLFINYTQKGKNGLWKGNFICSFCDKNFEARISHVADGSIKSCGCQIAKYHGGDFVGPNNILLINRTESIGKTSYGDFKCPLCGKIFNTSINSIAIGTTVSCGCLKTSAGEWKIKNILDRKNILYKQQHAFPDCRNDKTNNLLYFDFYLPDYNCCIEYDGEQHFISKKSGWNTKEHLKETQYRDNIKDRYCQNKNIKLIRIPYTDYNKIDETYIESVLYE